MASSGESIHNEGADSEYLSDFKLISSYVSPLQTQRSDLKDNEPIKGKLINFGKCSLKIRDSKHLRNKTSLRFRACNLRTSKRQEFLVSWRTLCE